MRTTRILRGGSRISEFFGGFTRFFWGGGGGGGGGGGNSILPGLCFTKSLEFRV